MSREFWTPVVDRLVRDLEQTLLQGLSEVSFHRSSYEAMENVASGFEDLSIVTRFGDDFLNQVYSKLIGPACEYGYYFPPSDTQDRDRLYRTSSAFQYSGNDVRFENACKTVLSTIDAELARRDSGTVTAASIK